MRSSRRVASSCDNASPPVSALKSGVPCQPVSTSMLHVSGVACMKFAPDDSSRSRSAWPSRTRSRPTRITSAPTHNGASNSITAMSKLTVVIASSRSDAVKPGSRRWLEMRFTSTTVRHHDAFRTPRRAGGVDHVRRILRPRIRCPRPPGVALPNAHRSRHGPSRAARSARGAGRACRAAAIP